ncbi:MAG: TetR/AcrR family transcriptional regulator [Spirosomataceae bacterium]
MNTRDTIIQAADHFIREKGFNAFSFNDIAKAVGIKTASIHYHFPTKTDLGVATVKEHIERLEALKTALEDQPPMAKLMGFLSIYTSAKSEEKICIVGSLATDLHTVEEGIQKELKGLAEKILDWVTAILQEGKSKNVFDFSVPPRTKALMIITNMLAIVQLSRLTGAEDFTLVKNTIIQELKPKTE